MPDGPVLCQPPSRSAGSSTVEWGATASRLGVFLSDGSENTIAHLTNEKLRRHRFPFPSHDAQERIADTLDHVVSEIQVGVEQAEREIGLIREYHTRLVSDVVTGKVDVRHLAPERVEEEIDGLGVLDADDAEDELGEDVRDELAEDDE